MAEEFLSDFPQCFPVSVYPLNIEQSTCVVSGTLLACKQIWSYRRQIDMHEKKPFFLGKEEKIKIFVSHKVLLKD